MPGSRGRALIPLLEPIFRGEWAAFGETLQHSPQAPAGSVEVAHLLQPACLAEILQRHAHHLGVTGRDLRASASAWSLSYLSALLPPVAAAASVLQHRFPVAAGQMALELNEHGVPVRFHIQNPGEPAPGSSTAARYDKLLWQHLDPLFAAVSSQTRLAPKVLWGNAARRLGAVLDQALQWVGPAPQLVRDRDTLLEQAAGPDGRVNPLHARQRVLRHLERHPHVAALHRQCCLCYRLPGTDYCDACPLQPRHPQPLPVD